MPTPTVGVMRGGFTTTFGADGLAVGYRGKTLDLGRAPTDAQGTITVLETRDGVVWASGVPFYDPETDTYFPNVGLTEVENLVESDSDSDEEAKPGTATAVAKCIATARAIRHERAARVAEGSPSNAPQHVKDIERMGDELERRAVTAGDADRVCGRVSKRKPRHGRAGLRSTRRRGRRTQPRTRPRAMVDSGEVAGPGTTGNIF